MSALSLPRHATWTDPVWLQHNRGVRPENALEYFMRSMFWAQGEGAEFHLDGVLQHPSGNNAIVIKRRIRRSEQVSQTQAIYYILDGVIYQCPSVHELLTSRLNKCAHHLEKAFDEFQKTFEPQQAQKVTSHLEKAVADQQLISRLP